MIREDGCVLLSSHIQYPVAVSMGKAAYPTNKEITDGIRKFTDRIIEFDPMAMAKEAGSSRALNMIMLGAIIGTGLTPITEEAAIDAVRNTFSKKFESINIKAVKMGREKVENLNR